MLQGRRPWLLALGLWAILVLTFSTRTEVRGEPFVWITISWSQAFRMALSQWTTWAILASIIIVIDRHLPIARDALARRILCHIPLSVVFTVAYSYLHYTGLTLLDAPRDATLLAGGLVATTSRVMFRNTTFLYWVIIGMYIALDYQNHLKARAIKNAELERLLSEARLAALRAQLNPHFLFNALNAVSAYVGSQPARARLMIEQLGDLLRLSLEHSDEQEVPLERELAFVNRYLQLQAVRFEDRLDVSLEPDPAVKNALVPPFILQPLVENAIRHGTSRQSTPGHIRVEAWKEDERLHLRVRDNGVGLPPGWTLDGQAGIGLSNTRERLGRLYGTGHHSMDVEREPGGGVRVDLSLPYRAA